MAKGKHGTSQKLPNYGGVNNPSAFVPPRTGVEQVELLDNAAKAQKRTHDKLQQDKSSGLKP